ncbi:MAG: GGDEF domain-containing protein [Spirochaetales bacterium]|nr:GGDEF domain-containing protein [Spirochaetales bacterium]
MSTYAVIDLNIFLSLVLLMIIIMINRKQIYKSFSTRLFINLCASTILLLLLDAVSWALNGKGYWLEYISVLLFYLIEPVPLVIWLCYLDYHLNASAERLKRRWYYMQPFLVVLVLLVINVFHPVIFYVDERAMYQRGDWLFLVLAMNLGILLYTIVLAVLRVNRLERKVFGVIVMFGFIPLAGSVFQVLFYGVSILWNTVALSVISVYLFLETQKEIKDYLTGLLNRQQIEDMITARMTEYDRRGGFTLVMVDMDDLKLINDSCGHKEGDRAIIKVSRILYSSVKGIDKVARFGGDEFVILLEDDNPEHVKEVIRRIDAALAEENSGSPFPLGLSVSTGYAVYTPSRFHSIQDLLQRADEEMYACKQGK